MTVTISWAKMNDIADLEAIDRIAHNENRFWETQSRADFGRVIRKSGFLTLIARQNGNVVGYLQSGHRNTKKHMWIENVMVLKEFRKQGIARRLVNRFISHWRKKVDYIVLITPDHNVEVFERLGFEKEMNYMGYKYSKKKMRRK